MDWLKNRLHLPIHTCDRAKIGRRFAVEISKEQMAGSLANIQDKKELDRAAIPSQFEPFLIETVIQHLDKP